MALHYFVIKTAFRRYTICILSIPIDSGTNWEKSEKALLKAANEVCAPYLDIATQSMKSLSYRHSLEEPYVSPRIHVQLATHDKINLILRIPVPTRHRGRFEQEVTRRYLTLLKEDSISSM